MAHHRLTCGAAVLAGLCVMAAAGGAAPELPKDVAKAATAADVAEIGKKMEKISAEPNKNKGSIRTVKGLVLSLTVYGDEATQGQAAKVLLALDKKDYAGAAAAAKSGGNNIEKDLRDGIKAGSVEPKAAEIMGARSMALAVYTEKMPNDKAKTNQQMTAKWERWAKEMGSAGKELAEEGAKGAKADSKKLGALMKKLDGTCSNCHNDFRNE
jgi:hypothetical protein